MLVNATGKKSTTHLIGLLPFTSYNCCVSAEYELYVADGICDDIKTPELFVKKPFVTTNTRTALTEVPKLSNSNASESGIVGGVLGAVVVILLILLTVTLVYLLWQSNWKRNATKLHR